MKGKIIRQRDRKNKDTEGRKSRACRNPQAVRYCWGVNWRRGLVGAGTGRV